MGNSNIKYLERGGGHYDASEGTPCDGPYQVEGLNGENFGIRWGSDPDSVVLDAQENGLPDVYWAHGLDAADLHV